MVEYKAVAAPFFPEEGDVKPRVADGRAKAKAANESFIVVFLAKDKWRSLASVVEE
jgi:hypothetical protein